MFKSKTTSKSSRKRSQEVARCIRDAASGATFEVLEDRRLFSVLTVDGTAGNDFIAVYTSGADICVNNNGVVTSRHLVHLVVCLSVTQSATYVLLLAIGYREG